MRFNVKPKSYVVLGVFIVVLALLSALTGLGFGDFRSYFFTAFHITLGMLLLIETSWMQYLNRSTYKSLNANDVFGLIGSLMGGAVIFSGLLSVPFVAASAPLALVAFFGNISAVVDVVVALLAIIFMFI